MGDRILKKKCWYCEKPIYYSKKDIVYGYCGMEVRCPVCKKINQVEKN